MSCCLWHCCCCCCCPSFRYSSSSSLLLAVHPGDRCHHSIEYATVQPRLSAAETTPFCPTHRISSWLGGWVASPTCRCWVLGRTEMRNGESTWRRCTTPAETTESLSSLGELLLCPVGSATLWRCWRPRGQSVTSASGLTSIQSVWLPQSTGHASQSTRDSSSLSVCRTCNRNYFNLYYPQDFISSYSYFKKPFRKPWRIKNRGTCRRQS